MVDGERQTLGWLINAVKSVENNAGDRMNYNPDIHHRRSIRLKTYDYSREGFYFITICTQNQLCLFGEIENGEMISNDAGKMVERQCQELIYRFDNIKSDKFIVMPNHFHGIINPVGAPLVGTQNVGPQPNGTTTNNRATTRDCPYDMNRPYGGRRTANIGMVN